MLKGQNETNTKLMFLILKRERNKVGCQEKMIED